MRRFDLERESRTFAGELQTRLNATITNGVTITSVYDQNRVWVGHGISKKQMVPESSFPLLCRSGQEPLHMLVSFVLAPDHETRYLMVESSVCALYADAGREQELCHFDYERDKSGGYPEAHMQIAAESPAWSRVTRSAGRKALPHLHFPVGGRRYRPTLEDIIEFLACEQLVEPRSDWKRHVDQGRDEFRMKQLKAAVRRHPEVARAALGDLPEG